MINRKLNHILLALLFFGALVTFWTGETVRNARESRAAQSVSGGSAEADAGDAPQSLKDTYVSPGDGGTFSGPSVPAKRKTGGKYEEFRKKFLETEETLKRLEVVGGAGERSVTKKKQAVLELRYCETQLNSLYSCIMSTVSGEEAALLAKEQQEWRKERDQRAAAAAKGAAGNPGQGAEYTRLQADETRERAYELLERYKEEI